MRSFRIAWLVPLLVLSTSSACSWIGVNPPPSSPPADGKIDCTTSRAAPIADTVGAVLLGTVAVAGAILAIASRATEHGDCGECNMVGELIGGSLAGSAVLPAILWAFSAEYGYRHSKRCRDLYGHSPVERRRLLDAHREGRTGTVGEACTPDLPSGDHRGCAPGLRCVETRCAMESVGTRR